MRMEKHLRENVRRIVEQYHAQTLLDDGCHKL